VTRPDGDVEVLAGGVGAGAVVRVEAGEAAFVAMWEAMGGQARHDRRATWFERTRPAFLAALS
jgi:hypothetical protein